MNQYQGEYTFTCKDKEYEYSGKSQFSFTYDDETDQVSGMEMRLEDVQAFDLMKEQDVQIIRKQMLKDIENLICADVVNHAIEHDLC
jgi:hypothetical protein